MNLKRKNSDERIRITEWNHTSCKHKADSETLSKSMQWLGTMMMNRAGWAKKRAREDTKKVEQIRGNWLQDVERERAEKRIQIWAAVHVAAVAWVRRSLSPSSWAAAQGLLPVSGATREREKRGAARPRAMPRPRPHAPLTHPVPWCHHRCLTTGTQENSRYCYTRTSECVQHSKLLHAFFYMVWLIVHVCKPA